jgi:hypothetical protein
MRGRKASRRRVTAGLLAALVAVPAAGADERRQRMEWETFVRLPPGAPVMLVSREGEGVEGCLVAAEADVAEVADTTGLGLSGRRCRRLVGDLLEARRRSAPSDAEQAPGTVRDGAASARETSSGCPGPKDAPLAERSPARAEQAAECVRVRRVTRGEIAAVYVPRGDSPVLRALKIVVLAAGVYFLALLLVFITVGVPST